jgi:hypothetical protein
MLVSLIFSGALSAGQVSAKDTFTSNTTIKGAITQTTQLSASSLGVLSPSCCMDSAVVTFQNYTPWKVQCFVNGAFVGLIYPGQTRSFFTGAGWNRPTARKWIAAWARWRNCKGPKP